MTKKIAEATFVEIAAKIESDQDMIDMARTNVADAFDRRAEYETAKNKDNASIHKSLNKSRARLIQNRSVAALLAADVSPDFVHRSSHEGSAYNVYAVDKLADLITALNTGTIGNAINRAVCKSLFRFRAAGETFNGEMARAAASDKLRVQGQVAKLLVSEREIEPV